MIAALFLASPARSAEETAKPATHTKFVFKNLLTVMCAKHDSKATMELVKANSELNSLCQGKDNPTKCLEFLGNAPNADPAYAVKSDAGVIRSVIREGSFLVQRSVPELEKSFKTCSADFEKAVKMLDDAAAATGSHNGTEVATLLRHASTYLRLCDKSFHGTPDLKKKWTVKDLAEQARDATDKVLLVALHIK
ncbi:hypothetical protein LINGRAHAP2_LOCUS12375 [Linum grandiflorum]